MSLLDSVIIKSLRESEVIKSRWSREISGVMGPGSNYSQGDSGVIRRQGDKELGGLGRH